MRTNNLFGIVLLFLFTISFSSCQKEEWDIETNETKESTVIEGTIHTSGGMPLANVEVKVDYHKIKWLSYSNIRHKAEATTDKNGKYRLFFSIKEDELKTEEDKELAVDKYYSLIFDMKNLDKREYIMPGDMEVNILPTEPSTGVLAEELDTKINYRVSFERAEKYTQNMYIPCRRYIPVTLKGFTPKEGDYFEVCSAFPYGGESVTDYVFPGTDYWYASVENHLFLLHDAEQRTYQVPCAMDENNIITIKRMKDGEFTKEEYELFVTKDTPESLTFEY